ncbi:DUF4342 domain-containing protein [Clostridium sediminicola]|uniref:DUF4342 domain-containing protein n=1 Tax=Clostridium sediminicola TaxID=3114879 RepID=UPI0031F1E387
MSEVTLEKIDIIKERSGVSYKVAKEALLATNGDVVEALIYIENNQNCISDKVFSSFDEFKEWIKDLVKKGNVNRIKIKKEDKVIMDIPVTAGVAVGLVSLYIPYLLIIGVATAVLTKLTIEIIKSDGSVEVVNSIIKNTANDIKNSASDVKNKVNDLASDVKEKVDDITQDVKEKFDSGNENKESNDSNVYQYTVTFEDVENPEDTGNEKKENE